MTTLLRKRVARACREALAARGVHLSFVPWDCSQLPGAEPPRGHLLKDGDLARTIDQVPKLAKEADDCTLPVCARSTRFNWGGGWRAKFRNARAGFNCARGVTDLMRCGALHRTGE